MRKIFCLLLMAGVIFVGASGAAAADSGRIILYTCYQQFHVDGVISIGSLDEDGVMRTLSGSNSEINWPSKPDEQLAFLSDTEKFTVVGELMYDEMFRIESLIGGTEDQGRQSAAGADDAGTEESYAVWYSRDGEANFILLGMSGESVFENTDPDAQALYLCLRGLFPEVKSYAYGSDGLGPQGFHSVPLADFLGLDPEAVMNARVEKIFNDCEEGPIPMEVDADEEVRLRALIRDGVVTGKADSIFWTGGSASYYFIGADDASIGMIEMNDGLLVTGDGNYSVEIP